MPWIFSVCIKNLILAKSTLPQDGIVWTKYGNVYIGWSTITIFYIHFTLCMFTIHCILHDDFRMLVEYPASGGALPSHKFTTVKLLRYVSVTDYIIMGCEFVFVAFIIYYAIEEIIEVRALVQPVLR